MRCPCLKSPQLVAFADRWFAMRHEGGKPLPSQEDFPLETMADFLPNLAVTRRREDGTPYYLFFGTGLADLIGHDLTGQDVGASLAEEARGQFIQVVAPADMLERQGLTTHGRWFIGDVTTQHGREAEIEGLTFPVYAKDGEVRRITYNSVVDGVSLGDTLGAPYPKADGIEFDALQSRPSWMYLQPQHSSLA